MSRTTASQVRSPGNSPETGPQNRGVSGGFVELEGEGLMYRIESYDQLPPFLVSVTSPDDHWLFQSTSGALTCGRVTPERALFPYETDDRLHRAEGLRGPRTLIRLPDGQLWEPFHGPASEEVRRNLYKRPLGVRLVFEEIHHELGLTFRSRWSTSRRFGLVRTASLHRHDSRAPVELELLDGLVDIQPALVSLRMRQAVSCLVDAYARNERPTDQPLAVFSLEARIVDRPEAAEALRANMVWSVGLEGAAVSLNEDSPQLFEQGDELDPHSLVTGRRGAFFQHANVTIPPGGQRTWHVVGDVHVDASQVVALSQQLENPAALTQSLEADIRDGGRRLARLVANVDGMQLSGNRVQTAAHASSALFNAMRGGVFADDHRLPLGDLAEFIAHRNHEAAARNREFFSSLGNPRDSRPIDEVQAAAEATADPDLLRLVLEYLPLWFSRRHGDPSRPWNQFAIRLTNPDGSRRLDWEGNWRDIFQNWEALCTSFPAFALGTVITFVDASSADGGNPYRITRSGLDWEVPDPDDPWSGIGYWGDHRIIYLLRLLELTRRVQPGRLEPLLDRKLFTYADIPYRIARYEALLVDPHSTIHFDQAAHDAIVAREAEEGADARLLRDGSGDLVRVTLAEKLLVPLLSKLCNLVVDGGIWMNTHRPEWNDANNALVGWGLSVVTAAHLRRYCVFLESLLADHTGKTFQLSGQVATWLEEACGALAEHQHHLTARRSVDDTTRQLILDDLGGASSRYREALYGQGLGAEVDVSVEQVTSLLALAREYLEHTLEANRRSDGLYHGYNVLVPSRSGADTSSALGITRLPLMLEGQVAVLDSGHIGPTEASAMLDALFASSLYREDQHSFVLYPPIERPGFLARNRVQPETARQIPLLRKLLDAGDTSIVRRDAKGNIRFHGDLANAADLESKLDELAKSRSVSPSDQEAVLALWEDTFEHRKFTGRSSTMYAYEGIGSIYWHMVSKLQLAVASLHEVARAKAPELAPRLAAHYHAIRDGLGPAKSPALQGAFPTDPHSHTPAHRGAQQPGMTGQAKEAVLVRWHELGVFVKDGHVHFDPSLLPARELLEGPAALTVPSLEGHDVAVPLPAGGLGFTFCQVPVVYVAEKERAASGPVRIRVHWRDGSTEDAETALGELASAALLGRTGELERVEVRFPRGRLWSKDA